MANEVKIEVLPGRRLRLTDDNGSKIEARLDRLSTRALAATLADEAGAEVKGVVEPRIGEIVFGDAVREDRARAVKTVRVGDSKRGVVRLSR